MSRFLLVASLFFTNTHGASLLGKLHHKAHDAQQAHIYDDMKGPGIVQQQQEKEKHEKKHGLGLFHHKKPNKPPPPVPNTTLQGNEQAEEQNGTVGDQKEPFIFVWSISTDETVTLPLRDGIEKISSKCL